VPVPPRLVATDLDGTIVRGDGTISARTVEAFARAEASGAKVVFVTGRPPRLMGDVIEAFGAHGTAVCSNGAYILDLRTNSVVKESAIQVAELAETARRLREAIPGIGLAVELAHETASDALYEPWVQ
jgi:HAD superfamily hydrolase (TIGR01484 family)